MENEKRIFKDCSILIEHHVDDDGALDEALEAGQASEAECPRAQQPMTYSIETPTYHAMCPERETKGSGREIGHSDQGSSVLLLAYHCCTVDEILGIFDADPPPDEIHGFSCQERLGPTLNFKAPQKSHSGTKRERLSLREGDKLQPTQCPDDYHTHLTPFASSY